MDLPTRKPGSASRSIDPDDAPRLDREWFERAEIREAERLVRPRKAVVRPEKQIPEPKPGKAR